MPSSLELVVIILVILIISAIIVNSNPTRFLAFSNISCQNQPCPTGSYCAPDLKCYSGRFGDPCTTNSQCIGSNQNLFCNNGFCRESTTPQQQLYYDTNTNLSQATVERNNNLGKANIPVGGPCRLGQRDCAAGLGCGPDFRCYQLLAPQPPALSSSPLVPGSSISMLQNTPLQNTPLYSTPRQILAARTSPKTSSRNSKKTHKRK